MEGGKKGKKVWRVKEGRKEIEEDVNEEKNPWIDVTRKGENQYGTEKATTFYVTNLPDWTTGRDLWVECQRCGVICDAVVPKRRDHAGKVFGFVRFKRIKDQNKLLQALNNVWIGSYKIKVNVSKFQKEKRRDYKGGSGSFHGGPGYIPKKSMEMENKQRGASHEKESKRSGPINYDKPNVSYRDILTGYNKEEGKRKTVQLTGEESEFSKVMKKRTVVAVIRDMKKMKILGDILPEIFPNTMEVRYLGGAKLLITFGSQMEAEDFRIGFRETWEEIFSEVWEWKGEQIKFERLAWIKIVGIPVMLWSRETGEKIGETVGKVVYQDKMNVNSGSLNEVRLGVIVDSGKEIKEEVDIVFRGQKYTVWISELSGMWEPEFIPGSCLILNEVEIPVELTKTPTERVTDDKEDEKTNNQEEREKVESAEIEETKENPVFCENWESIFGNETNNHADRESGNFGDSKKTFTNRKDKDKTGPVEKEGFKAQQKIGGKGLACKRRRPKSKSDDILAQAFSNEEIKIPDLNKGIPDPSDPFQVEELIWRINPLTKATKRRKGGEEFSTSKKHKGNHVPDLNEAVRCDQETDAGERAERDQKDKEVNHQQEIDKEVQETIAVGEILKIKVSNFKSQLRKIVEGEKESEVQK
ncbi:putative RNA recognition motif domain, nucleotide-binding alpha-beta plait domain superfamily [Helianthus annuus]|nr:putative RNA recognition motif domain, nucleotide-binding alpha-beta plait domain superfamily [Helianthus annuus]